MALSKNYFGSTGALIDYLRPGVRAVRRNWAPFLLIQVAAALLVIGYYHFSSVRAAASGVSAAKHAWGLPFVLLSGAVAGGVVPQIAKIITGKVRRINKIFVIDMLYNGFVFAVIAAMVNTFYAFQAHVFGTGIGAATLVKKTSFDMLIFTPILAAPTGMFLLYLRQSGFQTARIPYAFSFSFYRSHVMPSLPPNWAFWIPVLFCVYALPPDLQFPLAQLVEGAWSLLFVFIAAETALPEYPAP